MSEVNILGIRFNQKTASEALSQLESWLDTGENHIIVTPNPEGVMQARRNPAFFQALNSADLRLADGIGIVMAAKFKGQPLPGRVRGVDTIFELFENLNKKGRNFTAYFLGGKPGVAQVAKENMEKRFPYLKVIGHHHGYYKDDTEIISNINNLSPDILLVCTGMPKAEIWATTNRSLNARLTLCLGGTIDIMSGQVNLAPPLLRKLGLEWLYRLATQPSRAKRMLDIPRFIFATIMEGRNREK